MSVINHIVGRTKVSDGRFERQICTGLIVSTEFIQGIEPIYNESCLKIPFARTVARWALEYFNKYQVAPKHHIEDIFKDQRYSIQDPDEEDMIKSFLSDISKEYVKGEKFNAGYILDKTEAYFREESLKNLTNEIRKVLIGGRIEEAEALVKGYKRVARVQTKGVNPIDDPKIIASALDDNSGDKLFKLPGVLGDTIGTLERGWLFAFVGASGIGKSWWLMLTGLRALFAGLNVVFISMEMSEKQMARRIQHWINGQPTKRWAGELLMPVFDCMKNQEDECNKINRETGFCTTCIGTNEFEFGTNFKKITRKELTIATAIQKSKALRRSALVRGNSFKLVTYPSRTASMDDIYAYLYNLEHYENFIPDVIVTDYADKVKPSDSRMQYRHQIAQVWESHKAMAQERNCLVVTGSQSNTARTGKDIKQGDWSESIAKLELCDAGIALNMSPKDKKAGIMRALVVKQRDDYFDLMQQVAILHQLKIGRPFLNSCLMPMKKDDKKE